MSAAAEEGVPPQAVGGEVAAEPEPEPEPGALALDPRPPPGLESTVLTGQRTAIFEELLAMGRDHMAKFDSYKLLVDDPDRGLQARSCYFKDTGLPITLVRLRADGFTMQHVAQFYGNFDATFPLMVPDLVVTPLCVDDGASTRWMRMKPPKPLSPRTIVASSYKLYNFEDGSFIWMVSSNGNDGIYAAEVAAKRIKAKDVRAAVHLDFNHFIPSEDGKSMVCHKIMCMDVGGNVPDGVKKRLAKRQVEGHQGLVDWCMHGKVPEKI